LSYCVQCGVKLAGELKSCPLCQTPVYNPLQPLTPASEGAYPETMEEAAVRIDRGYARLLSIVAVLIPMLVSLVLDLIDGGGNWSPYVVGALVMLWCFLAVPLLFNLRRPYLAVALDVLALCGYLALIAALNDGFSWYLGVVLPLLLLTGLVVLAVLLAWRRQAVRKLYRAAVVVTLFALWLVGIEMVLDLGVFGGLSLRWSVYSAIPVMVVALMLAGVEHNKHLKEAIRKRLFI